MSKTIWEEWKKKKGFLQSMLCIGCLMFTQEVHEAQDFGEAGSCTAIQKFPDWCGMHVRGQS